ncbi:MAG: type II and III secretion system protein [Veillonellaceae bacterium]|mgnify:CR=1 FL=1|nr:type II and III secretion system protein [Veillonellaceae bacterium]
MRNKMIIILSALIILLVPNLCSANSTSFDINFVDEDLRTVLYTLATIGGVDIVVDDSVKGKVTMKLKDVSFETALNLVTRAKGLSYRKINNAVIIEPSDIGATEVLKLNYAQVSDIQTALKPLLTDLKLKAEADNTSNSLVISGSITGIDRVKTILATLDVPQQQVELEAKVVAINKTHSKDTGIDWSWEATPQFPEVTHEYEYVPTEDGKSTIMVPKTTVTRDSHKGIIRFGRNPEGYPYEFYYQAKINALISNGNAKMLAQPKVMTINGKEARILIGDRVPVPVESTDSAGKTTTKIDYIDAGIKLTYTPVINTDGLITAKVRTEVSSPSLVDSIKAYRITTREAETNVRMKDGETLVIGGLIGNDESQMKNKVPFLSDLPILGKLFQSSHNSNNDTEVVIFLTARVVK